MATSRLQKPRYILEIEYRNGQTDYETAGTRKCDAVKQAKSFWNEHGVEVVRVYPTDELGRADARGDAIYTLHVDYRPRLTRFGD